MKYFDAAYNVAWLLSLVLFTHESELTIRYSTVHLNSNILLSRLFFDEKVQAFI